LIARINGRSVAVEVKSGTDASVGDPDYHFDDRKQQQVGDLARSRGVHRVDYIGVTLGEQGALIRWLPNVC
jgi:Holliday junction resolvase-like predicted endonuclease